MGILLLHLQLCPCGFRVRDGADDLGFRPGKVGGSVKVLDSLRHFTLLEEKLGDGSHGDIALGVN